MKKKKVTNKLNILLEVKKSFLPKAEYVFRTFCRILNIEPFFFYNTSQEKIDIYYGSRPYVNASIKIYNDPEASDFFTKSDFYPFENINKHLYRDEYLIFLFSKQGPIFRSSKNLLTIRKDIISSAFYFLSCWQEYAIKENITIENRYQFSKSIQSKFNVSHIPIVDRYCEIFKNALILMYPEFVSQPIWPKNKKFSLSISHDIDYWNFWTDDHYKKIHKYNTNRAKKFSVSGIYKLIGHFISKKMFKYTTPKKFKKILKKELSYNTKSSNFFLTNKNMKDERQCYFKDENIRKKIKESFDEESISLHASPSAAFDSKLINQELNILRKENIIPLGVRFHNLAFNYTETFKILDDTELEFDSTLGFWENIGYRAGISFPFHPFDLEKNRPYKILEIPLIVMDTTLFSKKALNLSRSKSLKMLKKLIDNARRNNNHISLLWHNTTFDNIDYPGYEKLYWDILNYAKKNNGWISSTKKLAKFWLKNF